MKHSSSHRDQLLYLKTTPECTSPIFLPIFTGTLNDFISEFISEVRTRRSVRKNQLKFIHVVILTWRPLCIKESITHSTKNLSSPRPVLCHIAHPAWPSASAVLHRLTSWPWDKIGHLIMQRGACGQLPLGTSNYTVPFGLGLIWKCSEKLSGKHLSGKGLVFYKEIISSKDHKGRTFP